VASSEHGPELIRHRELPIFGLQFHPEKAMDGANGMAILKKVFDLVNIGGNVRLAA
jgi:anthranilate/para-aminobenzoate synthase component II